MLEARAPFTGVLSVLAAADIETATDGTLLDINFAYGEGDNLEYFTCASWEEWLDVVVSVYKKQKIDRIWFHNGGKFDYVPLVLKLYAGELENQVMTFDTCLSGSVILELKLKMRGAMRRGKPLTIRLADSARLMSGALADLADGFGLDGKDHVPDAYKSRMQDYKVDFPAEYHAYHKRDTILLLDVLHRYRSELNNLSQIGNFPLTAAATSMRVFQTSFMDDPIVTPGKSERDFTRLAFQGGRTEYVGDGKVAPGTRATYHNVRIYDANSQYPAMMWKNLFPVTPGIFVTGNVASRDETGRIYPGCFRARFSQVHGRLPIIKPVLQYGKVAKDAAWSGETYATYIELNEIERGGGTVEIIEGFYHEPEKMRPIFKRFVDTLYKWRLRADAEGNKALKYTVKILMNSLYGKFAIREVGEKLAWLTAEQAAELMAQDEPPILTHLPEISPFAWSIMEPIKAPYSFPAISAFITAHARLNLLSAPNNHNVRIIYCDTDSVHTQDELPESMICKKTLGKFKCENARFKNGEPMTYGDRKQYVYLTPNERGKLKAVCKGVPNKNIDARALAQGIEANTPVTTQYNSPSTIKTAINRGHKNPNQFRAYARTVKAGVSSRDKGLLHTG